MGNLSNKGTIRKNMFLGVLQVVLGGILSFFFILALLVSIFSLNLRDAFTIVFLSIFILLGLYLLYAGTNKIRLNETFKAYIRFWGGTEDFSIAGLAKAFQTSEEKAQKKLEKLIRKNYLPRAYIDYDKRYLFLQGVKFEFQEEVKRYKLSRCESCGGNTKIIENTIEECRFCHSPIQ